MTYEIEITPQERRYGSMSPVQLMHALASLRANGFVVLHNAIEREHLLRLQERMLADIPLILARRRPPFNWVTGNLQQAAPPFVPYLFRDVLVNDLVIQTTRALLGSGQFCDFYSGNTAMPSQQRQPVHFDFGPLWPGQAGNHPAHGFIVNIPVVDMSPENGATELWPGSHLVTLTNDMDGVHLTEELLKDQQSVAPPLQPTVPLGGVLIRDVRLWHAGMPNRTQMPRPMLALIHWIDWFHSTGVIKLPTDAKPFITHPHLAYRVRYNKTPVNHIQHGTAYAYQPQNKNGN